MRGDKTIILAALLISTALPAMGGSADPGGGSPNLDPYEEEPDEFRLYQVDVGRVMARQRTGAYWQRFSPFMQALEKGGQGNVAGRAFISPVSGESAAAQGWSLWLSGSPAHLRNRLSAANSKGYSISSTIGLDRQVTPALTLGLGLDNGYSSIRTIYNNGRARTRTHGVSLFMNHRFNDWLSLDAQGGYVYQRQKYRRRDSLGAYRGKRHSHGLGLSTALNASMWVSSSVMLTGRLGLVASFDKWRKYTEDTPFGPVPRPGTKEKLVQGVLEGGVAYWSEPFMPYLKAAYNHDLYRKGRVGSSDRDDFTVTGGFYMFAPEGVRGLSLGLSGSLMLGRTKQRQFMGALQVKWNW